jgi:hypothetical protein
MVFLSWLRGRTANNRGSQNLGEILSLPLRFSSNFIRATKPSKASPHCKQP